MRSLDDILRRHQEAISRIRSHTEIELHFRHDGSPVMMVSGAHTQSSEISKAVATMALMGIPLGVVEGHGCIQDRGSEGPDPEASDGGASDDEP